MSCGLAGATRRLPTARSDPMRAARLSAGIALLALAISACSPASPGTAQPGGASAPGPQTRPDRTLVAAGRGEAPTPSDPPDQTAPGIAGPAALGPVSNRQLS